MRRPAGGAAERRPAQRASCGSPPCTLPMPCRSHMCPSCASSGVLGGCAVGRAALAAGCGAGRGAPAPARRRGAGAGGPARGPAAGTVMSARLRRGGTQLAGHCGCLEGPGGEPGGAAASVVWLLESQGGSFCTRGELATAPASRCMSRGSRRKSGGVPCLSTTRVHSQPTENLTSRLSGCAAGARHRSVRSEDAGRAF